jgi:hypothetical protein
MTGLYVICSKRLQNQLSKRRCGYEEYTVGNTHAYIREEHNAHDLGRRADEHIQMLAQWIEDVRSVSDDSEASFFFMELKNRESTREAVQRGLSCHWPLAQIIWSFRTGNVVPYPDSDRATPRPLRPHRYHTAARAARREESLAVTRTPVLL